MTRTDLTGPLARQARIFATRDKHGNLIAPRIVVHQPRRGDIHQLSKRLLTELWRWLPLRYWQGLAAIELRARTNDIVGKPYGSYDTRAKIIRLYSCPPLEWPVETSEPDAFKRYISFGAKIELRGGVQYICWETERHAGRFLCGFVLAHELGHHVMHQFKHKRKLPVKPSSHEAGASLHGLRLRAWRAYNAVAARIANEA
jgi:hypothetical protein